MRKIIVTDIVHQHMFLSDYIRFIYPNASEDAIFLAILRDDVWLNGKPINEDVYVNNDDEILLNLLFFHLGLAPVLDILYEDENFIAIEKMPGVKSFDEKKKGDVNVYDMALEYMLQKGEYSVESLTVPYLCYTLPETAGGILLVAKHEEAYRYMTEAFNQRKVNMVFEAIVHSGPDFDKSEEYDYIDSKGRVFKRAKGSCLPVVTRYHVLQRYTHFSRLKVEPLTIRKNQVNVHLAYLNFPILGDTEYGNKKINNKYYIDYQANWLKQLSFSVGEGHMFAYLNLVTIKMDTLYYPNIILRKGKKRD